MSDDQFIPNQASNKEPAEGSRASTPGADDRDERTDEARGDQIDRDLAAQRAKGEGAGISNRPLAEEKREQQSLPPRLSSQEEQAQASETRGAGGRERLAGPRTPDLDGARDQPVMGIVPPEPTSADEAGEIDYTHGDAVRVRESPRGSGTSPGEEAADEERRRQLYRRGASNVSKG